jgi:protein-tyrosine phosphatase
MLAGPIALTSANRSGEPEAVSAKQIVDAFGDQVALVLDGGPCHYGQPSSVVKATDKGLEILREGVVNKATLDRLASMMILFVCTGNTCRSPLAEAIMRRLLAEKFGCSADEVEQRGVVVASAGVAAAAGCGPAAEAVEVAKEGGMELTQHESQPLTDKLVRHADVIYTLTGSHRQAILRRWPDAAGHVHLLRVDGGDVHDPIGGPVGVYRECAQQIESELRRRIEELDFS